MIRNFIVFSILACILSSCTMLALLPMALSELDIQKVRNQDYRVSGAMGVFSAGGFMDKVPPDSRIFMTSGGGITSEAIKISQYMQDNNISVTITGWCVSSCANYFVINPNLKLRNTALLAFHGGGFDTHREEFEVCGGIENCSIEEIREFDDGGATEIAFLRDNQFKTGFLSFSYDLGVELNDELGDEAEDKIWVPSREDLICYGISEDSIPKDYPNLNKISQERRAKIVLSSGLNPSQIERLGELCGY